MRYTSSFPVELKASDVVYDGKNSSLLAKKCGDSNRI